MNKKILAIDDNPFILELLDELLKYHGYEVKTFITTENILERVIEYSPDLILLDVMLDGKDGRDICKTLKNDDHTRKLPVILISATPGVSQSLLEDGGADDYVSKPFDIYTLIHKIEKYVYAN